MKRYARGPGSKLAKTAALDLALCVISAVTARERPGMEWTQRDIAWVCGVDHKAIQRIESRALRKVRLRLGAL